MLEDSWSQRPCECQLCRMDIGCMLEFLEPEDLDVPEPKVITEDDIEAMGGEPF